MSVSGEAIINRLPLQSKCRNPNNPMNKIINNTVGELLDNYDVVEWMKQHFIQDATGKYLDVHGKDYNVKRKPNEDDESYRQRIIYEMLGHLTSDYIKDVYQVDLYVKPSSNVTYDETDIMISDNEYLVNVENNGFIGVADTTTQNILNKKFVMGESITWL